MIFNTISKGGGADISNAVIQAYKVATSATVDANSFVQFVSEISEMQMTPIQDLPNTSNPSDPALEAIKIAEDAVVMQMDAEYQVYLQVLRFANNELIAGAVTLVAPGSSSSHKTCRIGYLEENCILLATATDSSPWNDSDAQLKGQVCTISGTNLTLGPEYTIGYVAYRYANNSYNTVSVSDIQIVRIDDSRIFVNTTSWYDNYACIVTRNGTTLTKGGDTHIAVNSIGNSTGLYSRFVCVNPETIIMAYQKANTNLLMCKYLTISGNSISFSSGDTDTEVSTSSVQMWLIAALVEDKLLLVTREESPYSLYAYVIEPANNFQVLSKTKMYAASATATPPHTGNILATNRFAIALGGGGYFDRVGFHVKYILFEVSGENVNTLATLQLDADTWAYKFGSGGICIAPFDDLHNTILGTGDLNVSPYTYRGIAYTTCKYNTVKRIAPYSSRIDGVSKEAGSSGDTIDIFIPQT